MSPRRGARGQAATWPPRAPAGYGPAFPWFAGRPRFGAAPFVHVRLWLAEEVAPGRLIPWLPIAFATGILVYFALPEEPSALAVSGLAAAADYAIDWYRKLPDQHEARAELERFRAKSDYYQRYGPLQKAIRAAGGE